MSHGVLSTKFTHCHLGHGVKEGGGEGGRVERARKKEGARGLRPRSEEEARRRVWSGKGERDGGVKRKGEREKEEGKEGEF